MQAEIIAIGDEILTGQTIDTNSSYTASRLNAIGIGVKQKRVIADDADSIKHALDTIHPQSKLVFLTGGLGPTRDDITKKTLLDYFGGEMVFNPEVYQHIVALFRHFGREPRESNKGQAYLPSSCTVLLNERGTAPGMQFEKEGVLYFSTPGVPYETEHLVGDKIIPYIEQNLQQGTIYHKNFLTQGIPESDLAERLNDWENNLPATVKLAYLPSPGMVRLRITAKADSLRESKRLAEAEGEKAREILGLNIFGEDNQSLEEILGIELKKHHLTVATAESCTGGSIAAAITSVAGSSQYFKGSVVAYNEELKISLLSVPESVIRAHHVVSEPVAVAMAEGARKSLQTDFAVATTGVAGPSGGTEQLPVGTICIAVVGPGLQKSHTFRFGNHRGRNIKRATLMALDMLRREVLKLELQTR